jgi:hypothetical protein
MHADGGYCFDRCCCCILKLLKPCHGLLSAALTCAVAAPARSLRRRRTFYWMLTATPRWPTLVSCVCCWGWLTVTDHFSLSSPAGTVREGVQQGTSGNVLLTHASTKV